MRGGGEIVREITVRMRGSERARKRGYRGKGNRGREGSFAGTAERESQRKEREFERAREDRGREK